MTLSSEQIEAAKEGKAVKVSAEGTEFVLLRTDVYDQVKRVVEYDDQTWTKEEKAALLQSFRARAGWDDPELDVYEQYRKPS